MVDFEDEIAELDQSLKDWEDLSEEYSVSSIVFETRSLNVMLKSASKCFLLLTLNFALNKSCVVSPFRGILFWKLNVCTSK